MTLTYSVLFRSEAFCRTLRVPYLPPEKNKKNEWHEVMEWWQNRQNKNKAIVNAGTLRSEDVKVFESAGRKTPIIKK